jgi:uncharacterized membrane protein YsdA (DUF1294 family)/cold shock CspA family protein
MRFAGRITEWNDDKGFGFAVPNGGGTRTFVHISQFSRGSRRPVVGDFISYLPVVDGRGRSNAQQIRHAGAKAEAGRPSSQSSRTPRAALGAVALAIGAVAWGMGFFPLFLLWIYLGMSVLSYLMYWRDKSAAQDGRSRSRTPENQLHLADLLGGWPGALIAQQQFHHKTVKQTFQFAFWLTVVLNLAGCVWLTKSGFAVDLARSLAG